MGTMSSSLLWVMQDFLSSAVGLHDCWELCDQAAQRTSNATIPFPEPVNHNLQILPSTNKALTHGETETARNRN